MLNSTKDQLEKGFGTFDRTIRTYFGVGSPSASHSMRNALSFSISELTTLNGNTSEWYGSVIILGGEAVNKNEIGWEFELVVTRVGVILNKNVCFTYTKPVLEEQQIEPLP